MSPQALEVRIKQKSSFKYRTEFIGAEGQVLATSNDVVSTYRLRGDERYVRAKVTDSGGFVAWIQPVFVLPK